MKFKYFILAGALFFFNSEQGFSQNKKIDSLKLILLSAKEDTNKVNVLNSLGRAFTLININEKAIGYLREALKLSEQLNFKLGQGNVLYNMGLLYGNQHDFAKAANYHEAAIKIRKEINDRIGLAASYRSIGFVFMDMGNYSEALKMQLACLKANEAINDKKGIAASYNNIGILYWLQKDYTHALNMYPQALRIMKEIGDTANMNHPYNNMAGIYNDMGNYSKALENYLLSLKIREEIGDKNLIADSYAGIGNVYQRMGNYAEALNKFHESIKIFKEVNTKIGPGEPSLGIGEVNTVLKNFTEARDFLSKALALYKEAGDPRGLHYAYADLAKLDSATSNYRSALENYKLYIFYRDSILNQESSKKFVQIQMQYEFDKKADSLNQKQILTETKLQAQKKQRYFYWGGLVMLAAILFFVFLNFRNQKKINRLAAETHVRQKKELELQSQRTVLSERLRISSELHDEVGATLSGIAMYSHLTKEQIKSGQTSEIENSLNVIQQSSAQMVDKLSDIVWLINPEQDSLQKLVTRLEEYARDMAAIKNMQVKITVPEKLHDIHLPVENRRNIYLFCKEAINNAVKYSGGTILELLVKESADGIEFSVSDNGKGFDAVMVRRGNGLENMQKRADEIGAQLVLRSKESQGVSVSMQCKIT